MKIGNMEVKSASDLQKQRLSILLWGMSGCGKTTLACSMPGKKLMINLDPDGAQSVSYRDDVDVLDLSAESTDNVLNQLQSAENPLGLSSILAEETYQSVILDSTTSLSQRALEYAVKRGIGGGGRFKPTMETPGLAAYGGRNAVTLTCIKGLLRVTGRHQTHLCLISHEDEPKVNEQGEIMYITMMLGGKLVAHTALQLSEVWWMREDRGKRVIAIRPCRTRKPMKTRMFRADGPAEFVVDYDPQKVNPISDWWDQWQKSGGQLDLPK